MGHSNIYRCMMPDGMFRIYQDGNDQWVLWSRRDDTHIYFDTQLEAMEDMTNMNHDENYINAMRAAATALLQILTVSVPGLGWQWNNEFGGTLALPPDSFTGDNADLMKQDVSDGLAVMQLMTTWLGDDGRGAKLQKLRTVYPSLCRADGKGE